VSLVLAAFSGALDTWGFSVAGSADGECLDFAGNGHGSC
jgi:hypothetical protein